MKRLRTADLRALLAFAHDLASVAESEEFGAAVLPLLRALVPCDSASFNHVDLRLGSATYSVDGPDVLELRDGGEILGAHGGENPLIRQGLRRDGGAVLKLSDFLTRTQLHSLPLYDLLYRQVDTEYQMAFALPSDGRRVIGFALNRRAPDFSERDREVLIAARPFVLAAFETASAHADAESAFDRIADGYRGRSGVILLDRAGRVTFASPVARRLCRVSRGTRLTGPLGTWVEEESHAPSGAVHRSPRGTVPILATFTPATDDGPATIHLTVDVAAVTGLTARETEVLSLVSRGLTNAQIAFALSLSPRTVAKHLQRTYHKLEVTNRINATRKLGTVAKDDRARSI